MSIDEILDGIIRREGGYVDHPADRGGPTNWGITQGTLSAHRGRAVTAEEVRALTRAEAMQIYRRRYVLQPRLAEVPGERLRELLVDWGVHSGPIIAVRGLQQALGVAVDGIIGPVTLTACHRASEGASYRKVLAARVRFLAGILQRLPGQRVFAAGWYNRVAEFIEIAP